MPLLLLLTLQANPQLGLSFCSCALFSLLKARLRRLHLPLTLRFHYHLALGRLAD
jgi:hypothetical protein